MLIGVLITVIGVTYFTSRGTLDVYALAFYGLIGVGFLVSGVFWLRYITALESARRTLFVDKAILGAAARLGGAATIAQITLETPLSVAEATEGVDRLCRRGAARPELLDDGTISYRFAGLVGPGDVMALP